MKKFHLIPNWKYAWKLGSIQWSLVGVFAMSFGESLYQGWVILPKEITSRMPNSSTIGLILFVIVIIARLFKKIQESHHGGEQQ